MEVAFSSQLWGIGLAVPVGVGLAVLYDLLRIWRILFDSGKWSVYVQDVLYGVGAALVTFLLALAVNYGEVRFYLLLGEGAGVAVYFLTLGRVTVRMAQVVHRGCKRLKAWFVRRIGVPVRRIAGKLWCGWRKVWEKRRENRKNQQEIRKSP